MNDIFLLISLLTVCVYALYFAEQKRVDFRDAGNWTGLFLAWYVIASAVVWISVFVGALLKVLWGAAP